MSDVPSSPNPDPSHEQELEVDIAAFLPEGTQVVAHDDWGDGAPEPEIPSWARDETSDAETISDGAVEDEADEDAVPGNPPAPATDEMDLSTLTAIEADLADVDAAIAAIDAGDLTRSTLLNDLMAAEAPPTPDTP